MKLKLTILTLCCLQYIANAQVSVTTIAEAKTLPGIYYTTFSNNSPIDNGRVFLNYPSAISGTAFLKDLQWEKGLVVYDSIVYNNLMLNYDIYANQVIIKKTDAIPYILSNDKITAFVISDFNFIFLNDSAKIPKGFYQIIENPENSRLGLLCKREKRMVESIDDNIIKQSFVIADKFYVQKNDQYHLISTKKQLYKLLDTKRRPISKHLKKQNLNFKQNKEELITTAIRLYNQS